MVRMMKIWSSLILNWAFYVALVWTPNWRSSKALKLCTEFGGCDRGDTLLELTYGKSPSKMELYSWKDHPTIYWWISMTWFILIPRRVVLYSKALQVGGFDPKLTPRGLENGMLAFFNDSCPKIIQNPLFGKVKSTLLHYIFWFMKSSFFGGSIHHSWSTPPRFFSRSPCNCVSAPCLWSPANATWCQSAASILKGWQLLQLWICHHPRGSLTLKWWPLPAKESTMLSEWVGLAYPQHFWDRHADSFSVHISTSFMIFMYPASGQINVLPCIACIRRCWQHPNCLPALSTQIQPGSLWISIRDVLPWALDPLRSLRWENQNTPQTFHEIPIDHL